MNVNLTMIVMSATFILGVVYGIMLAWTATRKPTLRNRAVIHALPDLSDHWIDIGDLYKRAPRHIHWVGEEELLLPVPQE